MHEQIATNGVHLQQDIALELGAIAEPDRKHILIVEDSADVLDMLGELLKILGYTFCGAQSAEEALDLLAGPHEFDILLTDITLPGISGIELARKTNLAKPSIAIVFTTGFGSVPTHALNFPTFSLPKPYTLVQLKQVLAKAESHSSIPTDEKGGVLRK
jgi:CheY-like chemotaxis protein